MAKKPEMLETGITYPNGRPRHRLHFHFLTGDCDYKEHGGKFVSKRLHNGDWHYWIVLDICRDPEDDDYWIQVSVVSPEAAEAKLPEAMRSMGFDYEDYHTRIQNPLDLVGCLAEYGVSAPLRSFKSANFKKAMLAAKDYANFCSSMLGFAMDAPVNRLGATGWDAVAGNLWGPHKEMERVDAIIDLMKPQPPYIKATYRVLTPLKNRSKRIRERMGYE